MSKTDFARLHRSTRYLAMPLKLSAQLVLRSPSFLKPVAKVPLHIVCAVSSAHVKVWMVANGL